MTDGLELLYERLDAEAEEYYWEQLFEMLDDEDFVETDDGFVSYRLVYTGDWA